MLKSTLQSEHIVGNIWLTSLFCALQSLYWFLIPLNALKSNEWWYVLNAKKKTFWLWSSSSSWNYQSIWLINKLNISFDWWFKLSYDFSLNPTRSHESSALRSHEDPSPKHKPRASLSESCHQAQSLAAADLLAASAGWTESADVGVFEERSRGFFNSEKNIVV